MEGVLKTIKFAIPIGIHLFMNHCLMGQKLFYCDTTMLNAGMVVSSCDRFFNFFENSVDSIAVFDSYEYDTIYDANMAVYKKKEVTIFIQPICNGCDSLRIIYFYKGIPFLQGNLLDGKAEGAFEWQYSDDLIIATFHKGKLHGKKTIFLKNGKKIVENYKDGILEGDSFKVDAFNKYLYYCHYKNGNKDGLEYGLHENGMLNFVNSYNAGVLLDGVYNKYDGNGKLYLQLSIKDGRVIKEDWKND